MNGEWIADTQLIVDQQSVLHILGVQCFAFSGFFLHLKDSFICNDHFNVVTFVYFNASTTKAGKRIAKLLPHLETCMIVTSWIFPHI